ncbi:Ketosynthase family 3 (KS3) domain-containing protein OS=Lysinibacillus sphaericus OX=1421 GN=LS41612_07035 PE=3 SV=1 [Lysinibacillus sphaericus]
MDDIVITGYGIKAPGILDKHSFLNVLTKGICTQSNLNNADLPQANIVAGVIDQNFQEINGVNYRRHPRSVRMAIAATLDAMEMANLKDVQPHRIAVIMGTSAGAILEIEKYAADGFDL